MAGVQPAHLRRVVTQAFQQRRKTVRNSLKKLALEKCGGDTEKVQAIFNSPPLPLPSSIIEAQEQGDKFALKQKLPLDWASKRPEELNSGQFVELTRLLFGPEDGIPTTDDLGAKVWRKMKHGKV